MSESKTSQRRLRAADRQRQALELRKAGVSFEEIARSLGYAGPSSSYRAVMSALKRTLQEPADEVRKLELVRLDRAQRIAWERMLQGDLEALGKVIKVMERRAKLLGIDAPQKLAQGGDPDAPPVKFEFSWAGNLSENQRGGDGDDRGGDASEW